MSIIFGSAIGEFSSFQGRASAASAFDDNVIYYVYVECSLAETSAYAEAENGSYICLFQGLF